MRDIEQEGTCCVLPDDRASRSGKSICSFPAQDSNKMGIVHLFGGVFVGNVAEEMCRTWKIIQAATAAAAAARNTNGVAGGSACAGTVKPPPTPSAANPHEGNQSGVDGIGADDSGAAGAGSSPGHGTKGGGKRKRVEITSPDDAAPAGRTSAPAGRRAEAAEEEEEEEKAKDEERGCTSFVSECSLPTDKGTFRLRAYRYSDKRKSHEPVVMISGNVRGRQGVPVRVHDQCQTSEVLGSKRCDCKEQLDHSLRYLQENGGGAVIYLAQEGRGIGLANKVAAYALQDDGLDTVDANRQLGFKDDERTYECVDFILRDMGVKSIQLMTNNPLKIDRLRASGVAVEGRIPVLVPPNEHNHAYLEAKATRMSHLINNL